MVNMDNPMIKHLAKLLLLVGIGFGQPGYAVDAFTLDQLIKSNEKITIIDIRPNVLYRRSHIYNAINIQATIFDRKRLPPLGRVIVYDDGIDISLLENAVNALNAKPGIQAEALDGGFGAWSARHNVVQKQKGLSSRNIRNLSYRQLLKLSQRSETLALVDLRIGEPQESLAVHFPNVRVYDPIDRVQSGDKKLKVSSYILKAIPKTNLEILILIDDGNGFAEKVSDKLYAAGTRRLAILAGGELALRVRGEAGEGVSSTAE